MLPVASAQLAWLNSAGHDLTVAPNPFSHAPLPQEALLLKIGSDINVHDNTKFTALPGAALNGYRNTVELLLENGAELDTKDEDRRSALFFAAIVIARVIAKQAGLKAKDGFGRTVLHAAVCVNNKEMKELSEYQFKL
jgi:ankyrin repeat protein